MKQHGRESERDRDGDQRGRKPEIRGRVWRGRGMGQREGKWKRGCSRELEGLRLRNTEG